MKNPSNATSLIDIPSAGPNTPIEVEKGKSKVEGDLFIDESMGWHTVDLASGNVSVSLVNATMKGTSVNGMIAFNLFEAMKEVEVGRKVERHGAYILPEMKIKVQYVG